MPPAASGPRRGPSCPRNILHCRGRSPPAGWSRPAAAAPRPRRPSRAGEGREASAGDIGVDFGVGEVGQQRLSPRRRIERDQAAEGDVDLDLQVVARRTRRSPARRSRRGPRNSRKWPAGWWRARARGGGPGRPRPLGLTMNLARSWTLGPQLVAAPARASARCSRARPGCSAGGTGCSWAGPGCRKFRRKLCKGRALLARNSSRSRVRPADLTPESCGFGIASRTYPAGSPTDSVMRLAPAVVPRHM